MHLLALLNVTNFVATAGYSAVFVLCLLQSCCVPTSSELTLGFAGALAAQGKLSLAGVVLVGVLGEVLGAYLAWAAGRYAGRAVVDRFGRYLLLTHRDLDRAEAWYGRHERFGVFGSRLLPVIRNFVALPAGIAEVPLGRFGVLTAAGSLLWDGAWAGIGYGVGTHWHAIAKAFGDIGYVLAVVAVGAVVFGIVHRYRSYKEVTAGESTASNGPLLGAAIEADGRRRPLPGSRQPRIARTTMPSTVPGRPMPGSGGLSGDASAGSRRWIASSSGRPPGQVVRPVDDGAVAGTSRWVASSSGRPPAPTRTDFPDSPIAAWEAAVLKGRKETSASAPASSLASSAPRLREPPRLGVEPASPTPDAQPASPTPDARPAPHPPAPDARPATRARHRRSPARGGWERGTAEGRLPLIGHLLPAPVAAKVPEVILLFWVVKILTTAGGEAASDYLRVYGNVEGGAIEVGLLVVGLLVQFGTRRYRAFAYWFLAFAIAIFGTGVADFLHLDVGIPYAGTTLLWAVILAAVFLLWQRSEHTLSIHSITTQRREAYYWATVFSTFALGTALGDFTAGSLDLGYLGSGILFAVVILVPALLWWRFGLGSIAAFWMSYVVTRPLGASFADYISKPHSLSGIDYGDAPTAVIFAVAVFALVAYLAATRSDVQRPVEAAPPRAWDPVGAGVGSTAEPELDIE